MSKDKLPVNFWFPKIRMSLVKALAFFFCKSSSIPVSLFLARLSSKRHNGLKIWYGFGTDWKGIISFVCARAFYRRDDDWWMVHSVLVDEGTGKYYHLTDAGAETGDDIRALCFYPLNYDSVCYPPDVLDLECRHKVAMCQKTKVVWIEAFLWALGLKDDVFLCHHYVRWLLTTDNYENAQKI